MIIVNIIGLLIIALVIWWFWLSKNPKSFVQAKNLIEIKVKDGVYQPANISVTVNQPITLRFIREDATPCAEYVVFTQLNISKALPLDRPTDIKINLSSPGEYEFTCQMGMYRGKLIARKNN